MKVTTFDHITLAVRDREPAIDFYGEILGLGSPEGSDRGRIRFLHRAGVDGAAIDLQPVGDLPRGRAGGGGIHHFALGTTDGQTLRMWKRWLGDHGVIVSGPYDRTYFESIYFRDPDGHIVEIATEGPGYLLDETPDTLGTGVMPAVRGVAGGRDERAIAADTFATPVPRIEPEMTLRSIHHVSALTPDLDAADRFYSELGMQLIKKTVNRDDPSMPHWFWATREGLDVRPNSSLTFFRWPEGYKTTRHGPGQAIELGFRFEPGVAEETAGSPSMGEMEAPDGLRLILVPEGASLQSR